jgi:hypothetical protein
MTPVRGSGQTNLLCVALSVRGAARLQRSRIAPTTFPSLPFPPQTKVLHCTRVYPIPS